MSALRTASVVRYNATGQTALRFTVTATGATCCEASNPTNPTLCDVCAAEFSRLRTEVSAAKARHDRSKAASDGPDAPPSMESLLAAQRNETADTVAARIRSAFIFFQE